MTFEFSSLSGWNRIIDIIALSFAEHNKQGAAIGIYDCVDFCAGAAPAVSDFIGRPLFLHLHYVDEPVRWKRPGIIPPVQPPGLKLGKYYQE